MLCYGFIWVSEKVMKEAIKLGKLTERAVARLRKAEWGRCDCCLCQDTCQFGR